MNPTRVSYIRSSICKHFRYRSYQWVCCFGLCEFVLPKLWCTLVQIWKPKNLWAFWTARMPTLHDHWRGWRSWTWVAEGVLSVRYSTSWNTLVSSFWRSILISKLSENVFITNLSHGWGLRSCLDRWCAKLCVLQPLARMGAEMTGVDAVEKNIGVASVHAVYFYQNHIAFIHVCLAIKLIILSSETGDRGHYCPWNICVCWLIDFRVGTLLQHLSNIRGQQLVCGLVMTKKQ